MPDSFPSAKEMRKNFANIIMNWRVNRSDFGSASIAADLQNLLLKGYDDLLAFAKRVGEAMEKDPEKYDITRIDSSSRIKIMEALTVHPIQQDLLENPQLVGSPELAQKMLGSLIRAAAIDGETLGYLPSRLLIDASHLGAVELGYIRMLSAEEKERLRE